MAALQWQVFLAAEDLPLSIVCTKFTLGTLVESNPINLNDFHFLILCLGKTCNNVKQYLIIQVTPMFTSHIE